MLQPQPERWIRWDTELGTIRTMPPERYMKRSRNLVVKRNVGITPLRLYRKLGKIRVGESFTNFTDDSLYVVMGVEGYSCISVLSTFTCLLFLLMIMARYYHLYLSVAIKRPMISRMIEGIRYADFLWVFSPSTKLNTEQWLAQEINNVVEFRMVVREWRAISILWNIIEYCWQQFAGSR